MDTINPQNEWHCLVTGGCGFIGSHFVSQLLTKYPTVKVINIDALTYAAHPNTAAYLETLAPGRYRHLKFDIADPQIENLIGQFDLSAVVNFAAESHVDRSILDPAAFVRTNVLGVQNLLSGCRKKGVRFVQVSTDEVYGSLQPNDPTFTEQSELRPSSAYAASKASADLLVQAAFRTYGQDVVITRCSNNYGPFQFPEKLIPLVISNALSDKPIPVYGDGLQKRDWIYVGDHCAGVEAALFRGTSGEVYNISANEEKTNLDLIRWILKKLNKSENLIEFVKDRLGHDRRYGLNASKIEQKLLFKIATSFDEGMEKTLQWYQSHQDWWKKVQNKEFKQYYEANYGKEVMEKTL